MARIRTIKPETYTDGKLAKCTIPARYLFIGLLPFVDDEGRMAYKPDEIKMKIFPGEKDRELDVLPLLGELVSQKIIRVYKVEGNSYLCVPKFTQHQRIDHPTISKCPAPRERSSDKSIKPSTCASELSEHFTNVRKKSRRIKEGKGRDQGREVITLPASSEKVVVEKTEENFDLQVSEIGHLYPKNDHLKSRQLPRIQEEFIAQAIIRDGYIIVRAGTRLVAECYSARAPGDRKFLPSVDKFFGEEALYLKKRDFWEISCGVRQTSKQTEKLKRSYDTVAAVFETDGDGDDHAGVCEVRQGTDGTGGEVLEGNSRKGTIGSDRVGVQGILAHPSG